MGEAASADICGIGPLLIDKYEVEMKRALVCAVVLLCAASLSSSLSRAYVKDFSDSTTARLAGQVTKRRDTFGIPHILAKTEEAAAFGFGYEQAEDHCLRIVRRLITASGSERRSAGHTLATARGADSQASWRESSLN